MVNIITGNTDSGNDIRQSLNNINHSGDYNDSLFSSFLSGLDAWGRDSQRNLINEGESLAENKADSLQADMTGLIASELYPLLHSNKSEAESGEINADTSENSIEQTIQLIADLMSSNADLKNAADNYISVNRPLPNELRSLLKNITGTEDYGILKEAIAKTNEDQAETGLIDIISSKSGSSSKSLTLPEENSSKPLLSLDDTAKMPNGVLKPETESNKVATASENYYRFEPRLRQISSNFSTANVNVVISDTASDIPEDNNMAFISGFIAGRQSYNKTADKNAQVVTDSRRAIPLDGTGGPSISEIDETEDIIDYANPKGIEKLKEALTGNTSQAVPNLKKHEIINSNSVNNNVIVQSETIAEKADETVLPKAAAIKAVTVDVPGNISDKPDQKQTVTAEKPKDIHTDYSAVNQDFGSNSGDSTGQKQSMQSSEMPVIRETIKSSEIKTIENDFSGLIRQQKTETLKNRTKALESKPGTSQELQRIRLSEFPTATVKLVKNTSGNTVSTARLSLRPEALGSVEIKITMAGDTASLSIKADSREAVRSLEGQIGSLREKLSQEGIDAEKIEVNYSEDGRLGTNLSKDSYGGYAQREYTETMRDFLGSFGETGEEESAGIINIDNGTNSGNNRVYIGQDSSFVQYV